jgi:hypothetical protein
MPGILEQATDAAALELPVAGLTEPTPTTTRSPTAPDASNTGASAESQSCDTPDAAVYGAAGPHARKLEGSLRFTRGEAPTRSSDPRP